MRFPCSCVIRMFESTNYSQKVYVFFFNDTATTEIYTLSLHDALPISRLFADDRDCGGSWRRRRRVHIFRQIDRKSTRLNSSHANISYAVFCLKKKNNSSPTRSS